MLDPAYVRDHIEESDAGLQNRAARSATRPRADRDARKRAPPAHPGARGAEARAEHGRRRSRARQATGRTRADLRSEPARAQQIKQLEIELDAVEHQRDGAPDDPAEPAARQRPGRQERGRQRGSARAGEPTTFDFEPRPHWDLGPALGISISSGRRRSSGARFSVLCGAGARLARALTTSCSTCTRASTATRGRAAVPGERASLTARGSCRSSRQDLFKIAGRTGSLSDSDRRGAADQHPSRRDPRRPRSCR